MTNEKFRLLDIATADMAFEAFGRTKEEMFENAGLAFTEIMTELKSVEPKVERSFSVEGHDDKALLFDFISELLFLKDTENLVFSEFSVKLSKGKLYCKCKGEEWDRNKHEVKTEIKAATYNQMLIEKKNEQFRCQMVLDT
jgi:SHS2 domain-containing protein